MSAAVLDWPGHFGAMGAEYDDRAFAGRALRALGERELSIVNRGIGNGHGRAALDIGAGTGRFTSLLLAAGWRVTAFDGSAEMLRVIAQRASGAVTVQGRLGEPLPFVDGQFDAVLAMRVVKYVADTGAALREMVRVVRPSGRVVFDVANRRSLARFGYGRSVVGMVTRASLRTHASEVGLLIDEVHAGPRLPHPALAHARSARAARVAGVTERALGALLGPECGTRSLVVVARRA